MKRSVLLLTLAFFVGMVFNGCEPADDHSGPVEDNISGDSAGELISLEELEDGSFPDYLVPKLWSYQNISLAGHEINFTGRLLKENGGSKTTTFNYTVTHTGKTSETNGFSLEVPNCAGEPVSWSPAESSEVKDGMIQWKGTLATNETRKFSVTFEGDIPLGVVAVSMPGNSSIESKSVLGPCTGISTISGNIFIDANSDGIKQNIESGIAGIPVNLLASDYGEITRSPTRDEGFYSFMVVDGDYRLSVRGNLLEEGYFTAPAAVTVGYEDEKYVSLELDNVNKDISDQNVAYTINQEKIIEDLEEEVLVTNTKPTEFWVRQFTAYRQEAAMYSEKELREFLVEIENTLLLEPFQFGEDKEAAALEILLRKPTTEYEEFLTQLLTAELNVASGRGVLKSPRELYDQFNIALLIYSEAVACRESGSCAAAKERSSAPPAVKAVSRTDTAMLRAFNGTGGI